MQGLKESIVGPCCPIGMLRGIEPCIAEGRAASVLFSGSFSFDVVERMDSFPL